MMIFINILRSSKIDIHMLNSYHNFVCDKNSYMNEINFVWYTFFMYRVIFLQVEILS